MRKYVLVSIMLMALYCLSALVEETEDLRYMDTKTLSNGTLALLNGNYGYTQDLQYRHLQKMLHASTSWISGKLQRRDEAGRKLFWLHYPPLDAEDYVDEDHELWNPTLIAVMDTLTSVGYDGDSALQELLPAYNPLIEWNPLVADLFAQYNHQDAVLQSLMGYPAPLPFDPFDSQTFCFSIPQDESFATPGFITQSAYYYDYCPFGTSGQRVMGNSSSHEHYPLGLAVKSESYAWNILNLDYMIINKHTIYNTNALDCIEDLAISHYVDADIGPSSWGAELAADDVSGYVKGQGYEFAYSRDLDGDDGLSDKWIASKLLIPEFAQYALLSSWFWRVGQGPDDHDPRLLSPWGDAANEKYCLATGRNPNPSYYLPLRPEAPDVQQYEQPTANDTRTMISLYGEQPGSPGYDQTDDQGNYYLRLNLQPQESLSYYTVLFVGDSIDDLKTKSLAIENFISGGMDTSAWQDLPCIPYLDTVRPEAPSTFHFKWYSYSDPDYFLIGSKEYEDPASEWAQINVAGSARTYDLTGIDPELWYELKVTAVYFSGTPEELYLESDIQLLNLSFTANEDPLTPPSISQLKNYPNPFRETTKIKYESLRGEPTKLEIFNVKGQKVRTLIAGKPAPGANTQTWDGRDEQGLQCASGVYYLKLHRGGTIMKHKMLLLR